MNRDWSKNMVELPIYMYVVLIVIIGFKFLEKRGGPVWVASSIALFFKVGRVGEEGGGGAHDPEKTP